MKKPELDHNLAELSRILTLIGQELKPNSPAKTQEVEGLAYAVAQLVGRLDNVQTLVDKAKGYLEEPVGDGVLKMV